MHEGVVRWRDPLRIDADEDDMELGTALRWKLPKLPLRERVAGVAGMQGIEMDRVLQAQTGTLVDAVARKLGIEVVVRSLG